MLSKGRAGGGLKPPTLSVVRRFRRARSSIHSHQGDAQERQSSSFSVEKDQFLTTVCLSQGHSFTPHTLLILLLTRYVGLFPHNNKQVSNTGRVSYNSTPSGHCLPGESVRPHRVKAQSHWPVPPALPHTHSRYEPRLSHVLLTKQL